MAPLHLRHLRQGSQGHHMEAVDAVGEPGEVRRGVGTYDPRGLAALRPVDPAGGERGAGPLGREGLAVLAPRRRPTGDRRDGATDVRLMVRGLPAKRGFGAHVHTAPCGADPLASGGHYQHSTDTTSPLASREVWLDLTTDAAGNGVGTTRIPWFIAAGTAGSVVIHANPTNTTTGAAGARLVCTDVPFGQ